MAPFARSTIGFERLLDQLETLGDPKPVDNYPPYNINRLADPVLLSGHVDFCGRIHAPMQDTICANAGVVLFRLAIDCRFIR